MASTSAGNGAASSSARKPVSAVSAEELAPDDQETDVDADCEPDAEPAAVRSHAESARMVSKLTEMGYSLEQSREALSATKLRSVHAAVEYLVLRGSAETEDRAPGPSRKRARQAGDEVGGRSAPKGQKMASETGPFADPRVRLTRVPQLSAEDNIECVSLPEILSEAPMEMLLAFNYMVDLGFMLSCIPSDSRSTVPITIVHGERGESKERLKAQVKESNFNVKLISPDLPISYGTHHTKAFIICFKDRTMRVVVHTANLISRDWGNKTQAVYMTPRLPVKSTSSVPTDFEDSLVAYLDAYREPRLKPFMDAVRGHDFSTCRAVLIGSVPGRFAGENKQKWGHLRLRSLLSSRVTLDEEVFGCNRRSDIIAQFSSIGSLGATDAWLADELGASLRAARNSIRCPNSELKIIYPTVEDVRWSLDGWASGGALPHSSANYNKQKHYMYPMAHRWVATRAGRDHVMPHVKTFARLVQVGDRIRLGWFLLTSANLSKAAWGSLEKKGSQFMIRSYELGAMIFPELWQNADFPVVHLVGTTKEPPYPLRPLRENFLVSDSRGAAGDPEGGGCHPALVVPVRLPYDYPLTPYRKGEGDEFWTWDVERRERDRLGMTWPLG